MPEKEIPVLTHLNAISVLDGRYWKDVHDLSPYASEGGLIKARMEVDGAYLVQLSREGIIEQMSGQEAETFLNLGANLTEEQLKLVKEIEDTTDHDVKAGEIAVNRLFAGTALARFARLWHILNTSRDTDNISYRLMAHRGTHKIVIPTLDQLTDHLMEKAERHKDDPMVGRTHGQAAVGTTVGKEFINYAWRLNEQTRVLQNVDLNGKFTGAVGNYNAFYELFPDVDWIAFSKRLVRGFGFRPVIITTQLNPYDDFVRLFQAYHLTNNIVRGLNQDAWRYASDHYFILKFAEGEVGSSTMAGKVNPIRVEQSEGNTEVANGLADAMIRELPISRLQGDLSDSTVIRNTGVVMGHSLLAYRSTLRGLQRMEVNTDLTRQDLENNYATLSEPVQQILRVHGRGLTDAYRLVQKFFRGRSVSAEEYQRWVRESFQSTVSNPIYRQLLELKPGNYLGRASQLVEEGIGEIKLSRAMSKV